MPRANKHLAQRIPSPLSCCIQHTMAREDATIPWIGRETLHLLTAKWLSPDDEHPLVVTLPDTQPSVQVSVKALASYRGRGNPFRIGVLHVCSYRLPTSRDEIAVDKFLHAMDPSVHGHFPGTTSYRSRADVVDILRGRHTERSRVEDPPSLAGHDRITIADNQLAIPIYSDAPEPSLFCQFNDWGQLRAALRKGATWARLVLRAVPQVQARDPLKLVVRMPDNVIVQLDARVMKVRRGRLLLQAENCPSWALQAMTGPEARGAA